MVSTRALLMGLSTDGQIRPARVDVSGNLQSASVLRDALGFGRVFLCGADVNVSGAKAEDRPVLQLLNPSTSTAVANIFGMNVYSSVSQWFTYHSDVVLATPTLHPHDPVSFRRGLRTPSVLEIYTDTDQPTSSTAWGVYSQVTPDAPLSLSFPVPFVIPPGESITIVGSVSTAQRTAMNVYWYETDA